MVTTGTEVFTELVVFTIQADVIEGLDRGTNTFLGCGNGADITGLPENHINMKYDVWLI